MCRLVFVTLLALLYNSSHIKAAKSDQSIIPTTSTSIIPNNCQKLDILFIIDASQSIGLENVNQIKDFIKRLVNQFNVSNSNGAQFAVIIFADNAQIEWNFNTFENINVLEIAISKLPWINGITNTYESSKTTDGKWIERGYWGMQENKCWSALQKTKNVFSKAHGMRPDAPNRIILFSDGVQTAGFNDPMPIAAELRSQYNARIISLGLDGINGLERAENYRELHGISGDERYVINVTSWNDVNNYLNDVITMLCPVGDVTFIIETSERIGMQGVEEMKQSVINISNELIIGKDKTRLALVHFSSPGQRSAAVQNTSTSFHEFASNVNRIKWPEVAGISDMRSGLTIANDVVAALNRTRPNMPQIVVLYARGVWDHSGGCCPDPMPEAEKLRAKSTILTMRAPSAEFSSDNLVKIAGNPDQFFNDTSNYVRVASFIKGAIASCKPV